MGLLVLGMHRSGTSAVAEVLETLGLNGGTGTAFESDEGNARGLFEWVETVDFDDAWLARLGGAWWAPPRVPDTAWQDLDLRELAEARRELRYFSRDMRNWYVKDPRMSLLVPLWDKLLLSYSPAVVVVRAPGPSAASMRLRSGLHTTRSLALWAEHYRAILAALGDRPSIVVSYEDMVVDPATTIAALAEFATANGFRVRPDVEEVVGSVDGSLRRQPDEPGNDYERYLLAELDALYQPLRDAHLQAAPSGLATYRLPSWAAESLDEATELWRQTQLAEERLEAAQAIGDELAGVTGGNSYRLSKAFGTITGILRGKDVS